MKKLVCTLLALAMLCSFMVVNASAKYIYEGTGFKIVTDYSGYIEGGMESDDTYAYDFICDFDGFGEGSRVQIFVLVADSAEEAEEAFYEEFYGYGEETVLDGRIAFSDVVAEDYFCNIYTYADKYIFDIEIEGTDDQSYDLLKYIIETGFIFDDSEYENDEDDYYEEEIIDGFYEEPTDDMVSTYWETDTFYIDTDMELVMNYESGEDFGEFVEVYYFFPAEVNGEYVEDDAGFIYITVYHSDDIDEKIYDLEMMLDEWYEYNENGDWDVYELEDVKFSGYDAVQFNRILRNGEFCEFYRDIAVSDGENVYLITIECYNPEDYTEELFNDLCNIVENDLHFNNAPEDDKADKDNKDDKDAKDKKDEEEKDNSTVIIAVAVVAGVVILGVTAIIVLGKKKKQ